MLYGDFSTGDLSLGQTQGTVSVLNALAVAGSLNLSGTLAANGGAYINNGLWINGTDIDTYIAQNLEEVVSMALTADGKQNTYAGINTMESLTTGEGNTGFGQGVMRDLTEGGYKYSFWNLFIAEFNDRLQQHCCR